MIGISVAANKEWNCVREYFKDMNIEDNDKKVLTLTLRHAL